ncbi:MAG: helix-turn-helix domain-containing protein [Actinobacteria bacterium]|nr:helix-turn-helix domain-containing protein [Actinomycetota bacterium]
MLLESADRRAVFLGPTAIHVYDRADRVAEVACIAILARAGLASDVDIATAFGVHRNTVGRIARRFESDGLAAVVPAKRGPKGPSKVTDEVMAVVAEHAALPGRQLRERIAQQTGVRLSLPYVYQLAAAHRPPAAQLSVDADGTEPGQVDEEHRRAAPSGGQGRPGPLPRVTDDEHDDDDDDEGREAPEGQPPWAEPPVVLPHNVSGRYVGLALYYPALAAVGLVDAARSVFALPRSARFGVRATTLCLFFMTILSKTTIEAAKHLRRAEFGAMIGVERAPCVKTLRRKLAALVAQGGAGELGVRLARRWVDVGLVGSAYLYVDGHMKVYTGKKHLQEVWHSQRRMPLPGINTYFVGDGKGRPLLFVSEDVSPNLAKAMPRIVGAIRQVLGERRFCLVFDRGGFDGKLFSWLVGEGLDFVTYQRGHPELPAEAFARREVRFEGRRVRLWVAEDQAWVNGRGPWRRVVVKSRRGQHVPILTSLGPQAAPARVACVMFARWRQENFFKYMRARQGLDEIVSYLSDPADPDSVVPNPACAAMDRRIAEARRQLNALRAELGKAALEPDRGRSLRGLKIGQRGAVRTMRELQTQIDALGSERKALPARVRVEDAGLDRQVMRGEAKAIVDRVKISAYNAEEWLLDRLVAHYPNAHDARDLLRSFAQLSGTVETDAERVIVRLDPPDTPAHRRALRALVKELNATRVTFPGTDVAVTYKVRMHHSERAA